MNEEVLTELGEEMSDQRHPLERILEGLAKPIPERFLKTRKQGGAELIYIEWHAAVQFLDFYTGGYWSSEIRNVTQVAERVTIVVRITIYASDATVYREASGTEFHSDKFRGFGEPITNAEAQAFKRAAAKFGLGLHLYKK